MRLRIWVRAARLPFLTATAIPVSLGSVAAWHETGVFAWMKFALAMLGALFIHAGTNLANDYFDHLSGNDAANDCPTPFSGGSRVIQEGLIPAAHVLGAAVALLAAGGSLGLYLNAVSHGNVILVIGAIGVFLGFFYSSSPFRLGYRGLGELAVGIGFGPLMVVGAYYVQTEAAPLRMFLVSVPVGLLIALVLFINGFPDYGADKAVGKRTLVVILGKRRASVLYRTVLAAVYLAIGALVAARMLPVVCLLTLLSLPLTWRAWTVSREAYDRGVEILPANASTIQLHSVVGALLCLGLAVDRAL